LSSQLAGTIHAQHTQPRVDARDGGEGGDPGRQAIFVRSPLVGHGWDHGAAVLHYVPALRHTFLSDVNMTKLPSSVLVAMAGKQGVECRDIAIKSADGKLLESAIPSVSIVKDGGFMSEEYLAHPSDEADLNALVAQKLGLGRLSGFVLEGLTPYGTMTSPVRQKVMEKAIYSGIPVARVGRGAPEGFADPHDYFIAGSNLGSTKARMLLMACLMKLGSLPPVRDPDRPTADELSATRKAVAAYQRIFDTH